MRTVLIYGISLLSIALAAAGCRPDTDDNTVPPQAARSDEPVSIRGCLTAGPERQNFMLTAEPGPMASTTQRAVTGPVPTYTYELVGGENLSQHVNQQVTIQGRLDDERDEADFEQSRETAAGEPTPRGDQPMVTSTEEVEMQVRRLFIESVEPTGAPCDATTD